MRHVALIGFGEAAQAFARGWRSEPVAVALSAYDIKIRDNTLAQRLRDACRNFEVDCALDPATLFSHGKEVVFSLVTADKALEAAEEAASAIGAGTLYLDCNSCSPGTKRTAARAIEAAGASYVDVAVMAPVHPGLHRTPLLLAGERAEQARIVLTEMGMNARIAGEDVGRASTIKMLRSVMIKGMEALTAECLLAARRAGVEREILASLQASNPDTDWEKRSLYNLERMAVHGIRRAAEMRESAATVRELGFPDRMTAACAEWQQRIGDLGIAMDEVSLQEALDLMAAKLSD